MPTPTKPKNRSKYGLKQVHHPDNPKCGKKLRKKPGRVCTHDAGWMTDHPGQGPCKFHGGLTPLRAGFSSGTKKLYSGKIKRKSLAEALEEVINDSVRLELDNEIQLLRALIMETVQQEAEPDKEALANLVDKLGSMVDRAHKHQQSSTVSLATMLRIMEQMGIEVVAACQETKLNGDTATKLCETIERRWSGIRVGAYTSGEARH